jgi:uncharacterized RDD family membrane protein YckC
MGESTISPLPREARPFQGRRAGIVTRMTAAALDGAVVAVVLVLLYAGTAVALFLVDPRGFHFPEVGLLFSMASAFATLVAYETLAWWLAGRTYGDLVMGLRVVGFRGRRLGLVGAFVRAAFTACLPIGLLWVAVSRENRSIQDVLLRTSVVYDWHPARRPGGDDRRGAAGTSSLSQQPRHS